MKVNQLLEVVGALTAKLDKVKVEFTTKIEQLEQALADVEIPAEATAAIEELKLKLDEMDAINPDQVVEVPAEPVAEEPAPVEQEVPAPEVEPVTEVLPAEAEATEAVQPEVQEEQVQEEQVQEEQVQEEQVQEQQAQ